MSIEQCELPLPLPPLAADVPVLPARMINEYVYCPRLTYLEWVQGEWAESVDTVQGKHVHRRVDNGTGELPEAGSIPDDEQLHSRSVTLSSERLGLIAKMDLIEVEGNVATPVDYKKGKRPHVANSAYDPERVQLCVQGLILEEHGFECPEGIIYFAASKDRVRVIFDESLRTQAMNAISGMRCMAAARRMPPPLVDSPKCPGCSLVGICLPDEVNLFRSSTQGVRPLSVARDESLPVYVQAYKAKVAKKNECLDVTVDDKPAATVRLLDVSQVVAMGNVYITTPTIHELMRREIPITWMSYGGWFLGHTVGTGHKNVELRTAQYKASFDAQLCLSIARRLVSNKLLNCRTLLRRNWRGDAEAVKPMLLDLKRGADRALRAVDLGELLGIEGNGAAQYFGCFGDMLKRDDRIQFDFTTRNRRPPTDPVNALLSFAYSMLVRTWTIALTSVGFDAYRGFYHQPRYGRPALSLDMMEPFRPLLADSCVITAINNGEVSSDDFVYAAGSCNLTETGRKRFVVAFERRLSQEITHPVFDYKVSYRRVLELQARLLGRHLLGDIDHLPDFVTR